jgi:phage recombination protein Bet
MNNDECTALATTTTQTALTAPNAVDFSEGQLQIIRDTYANGANDEEFAVLLEISRVRKLNPFTQQVYYVKRWDNKKRREVWSVQVSIEGLRAIAHRTGKFNGVSKPRYEHDADGRIITCEVEVYRKDWEHPSVGLIYFEEYVQTTKEGKPTQFWSRMPHVMAAKCAEAAAIRRAFSEDTSGLYIAEEMGSDGVVESQYEPAKHKPSRNVEVAEAETESDYVQAIEDAQTEEQLTQVAAEIALNVSKTDARRNGLLKAWAARKTAIAKTKPVREPGDESEFEGEVA